MHIGVAEADITPDFTVELSGFASRMQPCTGVAEAIFARCVYLKDDAEQLLWIAADVIAFDPAFVDSFREWALRALDLKPSHVMLAATHTHSAPATIRLTGAGTYSGRFVALMRERFETMVRDAMATTEVCEVVSSKAHYDLTIDRRNKPTKHVDNRATAIGFRKPDGGNFIAAVLNYTMHPVALGHVERCISPDWCGGASTALSGALPGKPIVLVTNGAAGNQNPPMHGAPREQVRDWGAAIARSTIDGLLAAKPSSSKLKVASVNVTIPLDWKSPEEVKRIAAEKLAGIEPNWEWKVPYTAAINAWRDKLAALSATDGGRTLDVELQAARIGDVIVLAGNGELFSRFTDDVRRASGIDDLFVVGYANRGFGYIPTREAYAEGGYETDVAHFFYGSFRPAPGGLELLAEHAARLVKSL